MRRHQCLEGSCETATSVLTAAQLNAIRALALCIVVSQQYQRIWEHASECGYPCTRVCERALSRYVCMHSSSMRLLEPEAKMKLRRRGKKVESKRWSGICPYILFRSYLAARSHRAPFCLSFHPSSFALPSRRTQGRAWTPKEPKRPPKSEHPSPLLPVISLPSYPVYSPPIDQIGPKRRSEAADSL